MYIYIYVYIYAYICMFIYIYIYIDRYNLNLCDMFTFRFDGIPSGIFFGRLLRWSSHDQVWNEANELFRVCRNVSVRC